jgi:hypothetical protein
MFHEVNHPAIGVSPIELKKNEDSQLLSVTVSRCKWDINGIYFINDAFLRVP